MVGLIILLSMLAMGVLILLGVLIFMVVVSFMDYEYLAGSINAVILLLFIGTVVGIVLNILGI